MNYFTRKKLTILLIAVLLIANIARYRDDHILELP